MKQRRKTLLRYNILALENSVQNGSCNYISVFIYGIKYAYVYVYIYLFLDIFSFHILYQRNISALYKKLLSTGITIFVLFCHLYCHYYYIAIPSIHIKLLLAYYLLVMPR